MKSLKITDHRVSSIRNCDLDNLIILGTIRCYVIYDFEFNIHNSVRFSWLDAFIIQVKVELHIIKFFL